MVLSQSNHVPMKPFFSLKYQSNNKEAASISRQYNKRCSKCFKISNTFSLSVLRLKFGCQNLNSQNACQNSKQGRPWSHCFFRSSVCFLRNSVIWVCPLCLSFMDRHLVFEILEYLPYLLCSNIANFIILACPCR